MLTAEGLTRPRQQWQEISQLACLLVAVINSTIKATYRIVDLDSRSQRERGHHHGGGET